MAFSLMSPSFSAGGEIPKKHTCEGENVSPALVWQGVPLKTESLALIIEDPDAPDPAAPKGIWTHWILYNLPPSLKGIPEGAHDLPSQARMGVNDWKRTGYGGPCPPVGRHRYFHKLFALDITLADLHEPTQQRLKEAMRGHVLATAEVMGTYQKRQSRR